MNCPNGCGEMESSSVYVEVGDYGSTVVVYICQKCQYAEAEVKL
jgi:hypothetical protein